MDDSREKAVGGKMPWKLYASRAISSWGDRMWSFAVALFMIELSSGSLMWPAIYGLTRSLSVVFLGPAIGQWVDRNQRWPGCHSKSLLSIHLSNFIIIIDFIRKFGKLATVWNEKGACNWLIHWLGQHWKSCTKTPFPPLFLILGSHFQVFIIVRESIFLFTKNLDNFDLKCQKSKFWTIFYRKTLKCWPDKPKLPFLNNFDNFLTEKLQNSNFWQFLTWNTKNPNFW